MATVAPTTQKANVATAGDGSVVVYSWTLTSANNDGAGMPYAEWADRCWQAAGGTWGGATLKIEGSNDGGTTWFTLANAAGGSGTSFTADGGCNTIESPLLARPRLTTVGVGASVPVICVARRHTGMRT